VPAFLDDARAEEPVALRAYESVLLLVVLTEYWLRALPKWGQLAPAYYGHLAAATALCTVGLSSLRWRRAAMGLLAVSHAVLVWREFPAAGNHAYLEVVLCAFGALLHVDDPHERALYLRAVRWTVLVIFFYSGLQKAVHGYWIRGQYLAFSLGTAGFDALRPLFDPAELERLAGYRGAPGDGPYLATSPLVLAASNGTVLVELALAPLLAWRRTRTAAALAGLALLFAIEIGAREVFFGLVFANAIALYLPAAVHRRLVLPVAAGLGMLTLSRLGVLPEIVFY
jgi:hypothetical protein